MTTVYPSSAISIMCDCPYTGKRIEVKADPENDVRERKKLQKELKYTKEHLKETRNALVTARNKLAPLQRILSLELGWVANPYVRTPATWKDRVREASYLTFERIRLVDYLRQSDPPGYPAAPPTRLSASAEDLLSVAQGEALRGLYHDRTVYRSENEREAGRCLREFIRLKEDYENKLYQNKVMEREIVGVREKISDLQKIFFEDKCLIDFITDHHFIMKGCFTEVSPKDDKSREKSRKGKPLDSEAEKFKKLWEQSRREKKTMLTSVRALSKRLELTKEKIVRAENACAGNIIAFRILTRNMRDGTLFSKLQPKSTAEFGKFSATQFRTQSSRLEAVVNENDYLRKFLAKAVLSKRDDLERFRQSLRSTAQGYRDTLEAVRNSATAASK